MQQPAESVPAQQSPTDPSSFSRAKKKRLLEQYRREWRRADRLKYLPLPRWASMAHGITLAQTKAELKKKVAALGVDSEKWEKPLRAESSMIFWCVMGVIVAVWLTWMAFNR